MKDARRLGALAAMLLAAGACGEEISLAPPDADTFAAVNAMAPHSFDVELRGSTGETYPSRIYFNDAGKHVAGVIAEHAMVLQPEEWPTLERSGNPAAEEETEGSERADDPKEFIYVRIGGDYTFETAPAWFVDLSLITTRIDLSTNVSVPETEGTTDMTAPNYRASAGFTWYASGGGSSDSPAIFCQYGAQASQTSNGLSSGDGTMRLMTVAHGQHDSDTYYGEWQNASVSDWDNSEWWYIRNSHSSGSGGTVQGSGNYFCR